KKPTLISSSYKIVHTQENHQQFVKNLRQLVSMFQAKSGINTSNAAIVDDILDFENQFKKLLRKCKQSITSNTVFVRYIFQNDSFDFNKYFHHLKPEIEALAFEDCHNLIPLLHEFLSKTPKKIFLNYVSLKAVLHFASFLAKNQSWAL